MAVITISRGSFTGGKEFAEQLGRELGYTVISREDLSEQATKAGVPVGKLQTAMVKPPRAYKRLGKERDLYISFVTSLLCEKILETDVVYHGHTGHLLLPGVPHILRIRVLANLEHRIEYVMRELKLSREKARQYILDVDADRDKWVRFLYGIDWHDPSYYDLIVHLDQLGVKNATSALCAMAELPDFKLTPASIRAIKNLKLTSDAKFALRKDPRTEDAEMQVFAEDGVVTVIYMPQFADVVNYVPEILETLPDCKEVRLNIAKTNILWLQDHFDIDSTRLSHVVRLAKRWDAAVELMRMVSEPTDTVVLESRPASKRSPQYTGGIEDDTPEEPVTDQNLAQLLDQLQQQGCAGGHSTVFGDRDTLLNTLRSRSNYSLIIIGDVYTDKSESARTRMTHELKSLMNDNLNLPVVELDEIEKQFRFGTRDILRLLGTFVGALLLFLLVFTHQREVLDFLYGESFRSWRIVSVIALLVFIPSFAYLYGSTTKQILKLLGFD